MAEWLGKALQKLLQRFESARDLGKEKYKSRCFSGFPYLARVTDEYKISVVCEKVVFFAIFRPVCFTIVLPSMLNYTIRPVLWLHKKNQKKLCPLMIAVTINRKVTYFKTPYKLLEAQWDKEDNKIIGHLNQAVYNAGLKKDMSDLETKIIAGQMNDQAISKAFLKGTVRRTKSFSIYAKEVRESVKEINRVKEFAGRDVALSDIDVSFLRRFEKHERSRGMANNTVNTTFKYIRRIMKQAKKERLIEEDPFTEYKVPKYVQTDRVYLVKHELDKLQKLFAEDLKSNMYNTLCFFLLGCYSGLRHSDWQRFDISMVEDDCLKLRAKKNKASVVLPIGPSLASIIDRVKIQPSPMTNQKCNEMLKKIAEKAKIKKEITCHSSRHTFGYLCATNKIPKSVTAELMGVSVGTVEVYYHLTGANILEQAAVMRTL